MPTYPFVTLDVFTDRRFAGNPLAVFTAAAGLSDASMQALAAEMNLSETAFVLPPEQAGSAARLRIFNRTAEMPFAGHPTLGTAVVLAAGSTVDAIQLELPAGLAIVQIERDAEGTPVGGIVAAPQALVLGETFVTEEVASCVSLSPEDLRIDRHPPILASVGNPYVIAEVREAALGRAMPDLQAFKRAAAARPHLQGRLSLHLYAGRGERVHARMFAPLAGTVEDPATGSANAPLAGLLLSLLPNRERIEFDVIQGVEMGRPSLLKLAARHEADGIRATVGGRCVRVLVGEATVEESQ